MKSVKPSLLSVSESRVIAARPDQIFAFLRNPANHRRIDGSRTVGESDPKELSLGDKFHVKMQISAASPGCSPYLKYRTLNTVVEFEENELIAWSHIGGHRWRYELKPVDGGTLVTETFDWSTAKAKWMLAALEFPNENKMRMRDTLNLLDSAVRADIDAYLEAEEHSTPARAFKELMRPTASKERQTVRL